MAQPEKRGGLLSSVIQFLIMLAIMLVVIWGIRTFVISPYEIPSGSMEATIMTNDKVMVERVTYYTRTPERGDIVTFNDPELPSRTLIKRVIATAGQTVDLKDGVVYVDGVAQDEPYTRSLPSEPLTPALGADVSFPYTVPAGCIWVMGDNRTHSADSRYFGAVRISEVTGKAICVYWPFDHMKGL